MGGGSWTTKAFSDYTVETKKVSLDAFETSRDITNQDIFKARKLDNELSPYNVMRECCDSEEHPNTFPVILALDVTGSMGKAATEVAKKLNKIMTQLYEDESLPDIEFCVMGIGDLYCDGAPIQISQFESDIRIAEQLDKIWFEFGGGGNLYESYTAAWYMGLNHCKLDCWKRGKKGLIITMGDEYPNPYLKKSKIERFVGDTPQADIKTKDLKVQAEEKFNLYHIYVNHSYASDDEVKNWKDFIAWEDLLRDHACVANLDNIANTIVDIIKTNAEAENFTINTNIFAAEEVSW